MSGEPQQGKQPVSPALAVCGYLGGKLAYRYGVRVADETTRAAGFRHCTIRSELPRSRSWASRH
ncbi:hypothetical protein IU483_11950 [Streptomyces gardneri]|nr:hypothetical protein [Streptomyces gardneri]